MTASGSSSTTKRGDLSRARLAGLLLAVPCDRRALEAQLASLGPLRVLADPDCPRGQHALHVEFWRVSDGAVYFGHLDQHQWAERLGSSWGGAIGALWGAPLAGWQAMLGAAPSYASELRAGFRVGARATRPWAAALSEAGASVLGSYHELMISVPGVIIENAPRATVYSLVLDMVTDSALARWADTALGFGYRKRPGAFGPDAKGPYTVTAQGGLVARAVVRDAPMKRGHGLDIARADRLLQLPLLGVLGRGDFCESLLRRSLAQPDATVAPRSASLEVSKTVLRELLPRQTEGAGYSSHAWYRGIEFRNLDARVSYPSPVAVGRLRQRKVP
ncbi:MAG TPA: hypothetical protein VN894_01685 [Polyangiaceae bacterium]|nr:hypothetical protein [Polyangiaceae bacterium]